MPRVHGEVSTALTSRPQVQRALLALTPTLEKLQEVKGRVLEALEQGLSQRSGARSTMRMLPTFICSTPDGTGETALLDAVPGTGVGSSCCSRGQELPCEAGSPSLGPCGGSAGNRCPTAGGCHGDGAGSGYGAGSRGLPDPAYVCSSVESGDVLVAELCQSHVRTLWVTLTGDGNQSPQLMYHVFEMPEDIPRGSGEAVQAAGTALGALG